MTERVRNMKHAAVLLLALCLLLQAGCAGRSAPAPAAPETAAASETPTEAATEAAEPDCDVDLVGLDAFDAFSAVYEILDHAEDYEGKRIRMEGVCDVFEYPDHVVYGCMTEDPTDDCRQQGMEFVLSDAYEEDDYPAVGSWIVICGELELFPMGDFTFCHLVNCTLQVVDKHP